MRLALYQPDIPQNTGTILRTAACLGVAIEIIRPAGFDLSARALRRSLMDYGDGLEVCVHDDWTAFHDSIAAADGARLIALTTTADTNYHEFNYRTGDVLLLGRETAGLPDHVHAAADARLKIPMAAGRRSLNIAVAAAIVLGEALRQTGSLPV